ncbi:MAG: heme ABC transporter ATP-binding protein [Rhodobacteraceae bacterium]|jgi:iron complex transport system ATP-binding protein|nr:heme ABC transporter ATP-binding protein [Paracoccaceae bacterium]
MLAIRDLHVRLSGRPILSGISLAVDPGTLTAIVGPSGSGKSTLLRAISGEIGYSGTVALNGCEVGAAAPEALARQRAVLPQETQVAFSFTAAEVVALGAHGGPPPPRARIEALLARVGLAGMAGRLVQNLSGGERQRVHLARVLLQAGAPVGPEGPHWLFLDEPVASLDIAQQLAVMRIARAHADGGGGVLAVMHDLNLSAMFADRIVVLSRGRVVTAGPPAEVLTGAMIETVYGCRIPVCTLPEKGPWLLVQAAGAP